MSKGYLCIDLKDEKGNIKTCYLLHDDIDKIVRFTSYCTCFDMFLNTLDKNNNTNIKQLVKYNYKNTNIYYKKSKDGTKINALYSIDEDVFYAGTNDIYSFLRATNFICYNGYFPNNEQVVDLYKFLASMITSDVLKRRIIENFNEEYDYDRNHEYLKYQSREFYEKIALSSKNVNEVLNYIFSDSYKKIVFLKYLKNLTGKNLISSGKLETNKSKIDYKISRNGYNPRKMINIINNNILSFLKINKEKAKQVQKEDYVLESEDDFTDRYEAMLNDPNIDPDLIDDIYLYVDAQKEEFLHNRRK